MTPKKPSRGCGRSACSAGSGTLGSPAAKVRGVHAAGKAIHVWMAILLGAVQAGTAGEDQVGALQQLRSRSINSGGAPRNAESSSMQS